MEAHTHKTWILSVKCWIIWCPHPLVRLLLPHICMCVHKQIHKVADTRHTASIHTDSIFHSLSNMILLHMKDIHLLLVQYVLLTNLPFLTTLNTPLPHTNNANSTFFQSDSHPCSTQPTHLLLSPTALDVLARAFPIKLFYHESSPLGWIE